MYRKSSDYLFANRSRGFDMDLLEELGHMRMLLVQLRETCSIRLAVIERQQVELAELRAELARVMHRERNAIIDVDRSEERVGGLICRLGMDDNPY